VKQQQQQQQQQLTVPNNAKKINDDSLRPIGNMLNNNLIQ
jgi:hypothetical protein